MSAREDSAFPPSGSDRVAPPLLAPAALPTKKNAAAGASAAPSGLDRAQLARLDARRKKKGVVYMSRVPPNMRPPKVRHLLSQYAPIGRIYLAAEDPAATKARRKGTSAGGSGVGAARPRPTGRRSKRFTEGWVEFECKGDARATAAALNGQPVGGPPRASHRHDLWTLRYLPGFRWEHLTEEVAYQNAVREQRLAVEAGAAARERDFYAGRVGAARAVEAQAARRAKRGEAAAAAAAGGEGGGGGGAAPAPVPPPKPQPVRRTFSQKPAVEAKGRPWLALALPAGLAAKAALSGRRGKKAPVRQPLGGLGFDEFGERIDGGAEPVFVCERVCTSPRLLRRMGGLSKDPTPNTCVTVCGTSGEDACMDACARAVCGNMHQVPAWNDACLKRCAAECARGRARE